MQYFADFLKWYNNKCVVPTLEAMQKMIEFYHNKGIIMLKLGCALPNSANICLHKSTESKFHPFTESDKHLLEKIRQDMVGGPSVVFTRKAVVDEFFIRKSSSLCKSMLASKLVSFIPTQCANQCQLVCIRDGSTILKLRYSQLAQTNFAPLRICFCHTFNKVAQIAKLRVMSLLVDKKN